MSDRELARLLKNADEPVPEVFHHAMEATLASIAKSEPNRGHRGLPVPRRLWRTVALAAALMMLTSVAVAAIAHQGVIAVVWGVGGCGGGRVPYSAGRGYQNGGAVCDYCEGSCL